MKLAELKRLVVPGVMLRKVKGWPRKGRQDTMRVVVSANSVGFAMEGEGILPSKGPSYMNWPKAKQLKGTPAGFVIIDDDVPDKPEAFEYEWVDPANPTPKDKAARFILGEFEHCMDEDDAILALGDILGNHEAAAETIRGWYKLKPELIDALLQPECCDRSLRLWLDTAWNWTDVPQTIEV